MYYELAQLSNRCSNLAWLGLLSVPVLVLIDESCNLAGEFPKFSYQTRSQSQILHVLVGVVAHPDIFCIQSWCSLVGTEA